MNDEESTLEKGIRATEKINKALADERDRCVDAFAISMKVKLAKNAHKGDRPGWLGMSLAWLLGRLKGEVKELDDALDAVVLAAQPTTEARKAVASECFDVANFAMFIADKAGALDVADVALPEPEDRPCHAVGCRRVATRRGVHPDNNELRFCDDHAPFDERLKMLEERIIELETRVAHAEIARDNACAQRDEVMRSKKLAGDSAARRIERLIALARQMAEQAAGSSDYVAEVFEPELREILE